MRSNTLSPLPYAAVTATTDNILSLEGKPYLNYINSIKSPASQKTYIFSLKKYMRFHNYKTIDELLADKNTPTIIEEKIIDFIIALRTDSDFVVSFRTRATYLTAILSYPILCWLEPFSLACLLFRSLIIVIVDHQCRLSKLAW
ncbi:MAG: hypothetical protein K0S67_2440 [Nitrososphaeraceae archaeon]|nr:hypothetical protein [Nitrososphaeraceae archaeon]